MDGKNIADFIDPDIAEKLEALEREEERLEAEGYYESEDEAMYGSFDEAEAREVKKALEGKIKSQAMKKAMKNKARLPRTAGLRTLTEMSEELTKAGLDPSIIEKRAHALARIEIDRQQLAKRKRGEVEEEDTEEEDTEMDYEDDENWEDEGEMDVDEDENVPRKRTRTESGAVAVTDRRAPRSNRNLAGLRDANQADKANKLRNFSQRPRNRLAKAGEGDRTIRTKMPKHLFAGKRKMGKTNRR